MIIIESLLNRLRGTGLLYSFGVLSIFKWKLEIKIVWNHIYGLYLGLLVGYFANSITAGILAFILYIVGESKGWGEWVGALTRYEGYNEEWLEEQYQDKEGKTFPYIHQITSIFKPERIPMESYEVNIKQYLDYASLALVFRGIYWWMPIYLLMAYYDITNWWTAIVAGLLLGYVFPIAYSLGKSINLNGNIGIINYSRGWENQELVYGVFQGIIFWSVIFSSN